MRTIRRMAGGLAVLALAASSIAASSFSSTPCALEQPGLWETTAAGCRQVGASLEWSGSLYDGTSAPTYAETKAYCDAKTDGGFDDWRMPLKTELQSAAAEGAGTHINLIPYSANTSHWWAGETSNDGKKGTAVSLGTGETISVNISTKVRGGGTRYSELPGVCVR